jgi:hypothetical protein
MSLSDQDFLTGKNGKPAPVSDGPRIAQGSGQASCLTAKRIDLLTDR